MHFEMLEKLCIQVKNYVIDLKQFTICSNILLRYDRQNETKLMKTQQIVTEMWVQAEIIVLFIN